MQKYPKISLKTFFWLTFVAFYFIKSIYSLQTGFKLAEEFKPNGANELVFKKNVPRNVFGVA